MTLILRRLGIRRNEEKLRGELLHRRGSAKGNGSTLIGQGGAGGHKKPRGILPWNALQERIDRPSEEGWDAAA